MDEDDEEERCPVCGCRIQQCILCGDDYRHGCTTGGDECQSCLNGSFETKKPEAEQLPASGEEMEALFAKWRAEGGNIMPDLEAGYEEMQRRIEASGVTMRRVDISGHDET